MGTRTTPLTNHSFQPKFYPKRSLKKRLQEGEESSEQQAAGVTGPRQGRAYKITPSSSPTPPDLDNDHLSSDVLLSGHKGSFMAEVEPTGKDGRISLDRMVSIRLHVTEEAPVISEARQGGERQTTTTVKRWLSTDALNAQRSDSTTQSAVEGVPPLSKSTTRGRITNRFLPNNKVGVRVNRSEISENSSVLNKETKGKRHSGKKHWKIRRIFGIKN